MDPAWFLAAIPVVGGVVGGAWKFLSTSARDKRRENRELLTGELERVTARLEQVMPTVDATMDRYLDVSSKLVGALDELANIKSSHARERRQMLAIIGGYSLDLADLRRFFTETTGLPLPAHEDAIDILAEAVEVAREQGYRPMKLPPAQPKELP